MKAEEVDGAKFIDPDLKRVASVLRDLHQSVTDSKEDVDGWFGQLKSLYENPKVPVRFKIVYELSTIARPESVELLKRALAQDKSPLVRHEAASGLGEIGDESTIPALVTALGDEDGIVRHEAAMALDGIGDETALPGLKEHLADSDPIVATSCEVAISSILLRRSN